MHNVPTLWGLKKLEKPTALHYWYDQFAESRSGPLQTPKRKRASVTAHLRIIDALESRDPKEARRAMTAHLKRIESLLFAPLSSEEDTE